MDDSRSTHSTFSSFPLFILSGGVGASGEQVVRMVLAQFPNANVTLRVFPKITQENQVEELFEHAAGQGALIVHTFVAPHLRAAAEKLAGEMNFVAEVSKRLLFASYTPLASGLSSQTCPKDFRSLMDWAFYLTPKGYS